jgi:hypothetical protein
MRHSQHQGAHVTRRAGLHLHRPWLLQACRRSSCVRTLPMLCCSGWGPRLQLAAATQDRSELQLCRLLLCVH